MDKKQLIKLLVCVVVALVLWNLPAAYLGMPDLTVIEQRVIALFAFTALMWILETIPIWTTSVLTVVLMIVTVSTSSFNLLGPGENAEAFGKVISHKAIMAAFADPIIMLFLGGFALAMAATKVGLDVNLARVMLKPFGTRSEIVLLGFMIVTALFSMFMSNTATAAMMLAIMAPVLRQLPADGKGKIALALAVPVAANVGGIGTPIGTPPNAIALKYLSESGMSNIGFGQWMLIMVPFVIVIMAVAWLLLLKIYPFKQKNIEISINGEFKKDTKSIIVYVTFALTVILWILDKDRTGIDANSVALIPFAIFCITGVLDKNDLKNMSWDVLWLVAGGFALGVGLKDSGLASHIVSSIPFDTWSPIMVFIGSGLVCYLMATFMSHTATANLLMPILGALAVGMKDSIEPYGGAVTMLIGVAIASSLAMALPISTPPNALAHSTGFIEQKDMARIGVSVGIIGVALGYVLLLLVGGTGFFN